jgi:O-methyltransferase
VSAALTSRAGQLLRRCLRGAGLGVVRLRSLDPLPVDATAADAAILRRARPFSLTTYHRLAAMLDATAYVVSNAVHGAIVECGVWRGGSMMVAAMKLLQMAQADRELYLYDTYAGMPPPRVEDADFAGATAADILKRERKGTGTWAEASIEEVRANLRSTGYPPSRLRLVAGRVETTLQASVPDSIAILRLDTDWYESTRHELAVLYPRLQPGGVLIVDDYGHWLGARKAVDEYFAGLGARPFFARVDYTCRVLVKAR